MDKYIVFKILKYADICKCILNIQNQYYTPKYNCQGTDNQNFDCKNKLCDLCCAKCNICNYIYCDDCNGGHYNICIDCNEYICYYCFNRCQSCCD
jgi:hypothetical protein